MTKIKHIYAVRHAKSSWNFSELVDFERPLNKRGKKNAPLIGAILRKIINKPDLIISSPATRAYQTAKILAKELNYSSDRIKTNIEIYQAEEVELFRIIKKISDKYRSLMIIGHNPAITDLCNMLSNNSTIENLPTCGVMGLEFEIESWNDITRKTGTVRFFEYPKKHLDLAEEDNVSLNNE